MTTNTHDGWTVTRTETGLHLPLFSIAAVSYVAHTLEHESGAVMTLSHRTDDPEGAWCVDFAAQPNGMPLFAHGTADRSCAKRTAPADVAAWLDSLEAVTA